MDYLQQITRLFPVRKSPEQKEAFLRWAASQAKNAGWTARTEDNGRHRNFIIGDPEKARVIFTAHYDTPSVMPLPNLLIPRNLPLFFLWQLLIVALLFIPSLLASFLAYLVFGSTPAIYLAFLITYFALLILMVAGPANRGNVNDNTSGVTAVTELMSSLRPEERDRAAFILFDNEEQGRLGSRAYATAHQDIKKNSLVVNLDCVGLGDHLLVVAKNMARATPEYALLQDCFTPSGGFTPHFYPGTGTVVNSDQRSFRRGVCCLYCFRRPLVGFYTPRLHTRRDTRADRENLDYLIRGLTAFVKQL